MCTVSEEDANASKSILVRVWFSYTRVSRLTLGSHPDRNAPPRTSRDSALVGTRVFKSLIYSRRNHLYITGDNRSQ